MTDFSTTSAAAGTIHLAGDVANEGSMTAEGTMRMAEPFAGTDLVVHFRDVPMPLLTPYSAEFAGYAIERGSLDLDIHYRIADRRLQGDHRLVATDLTLGQKVGGTRAGFAVRLAVALLKDRSGKIDLQVPIEGTVDSPDFNYRSVLWQALKTIMGNIVKAPFRALGRAMGLGSAENLQLVSFDPGESAIAPAETETLHKMATELAARPELVLEIEGRYDPKLDSAAMKRAKLESLIASRRDAVKNGEAPSLESILESLYTEAFSAERLAAERAKFTSHPPAPPAGKGKAAAPQPETFDANGFYDALRAELLAAQAVTADDLRQLARTRANAVAAVLTVGGTLPAARVKEIDPTEAKLRQGSQQVDAEMKLIAAGAGD